jgi:hypothetical protein
MRKTYWQPQIDNWIINENDANNYAFNPTNFAVDKMAGNVPVKNEEEETDSYDKLEQPYKGINTLEKLKKEINRLLTDLKFLSDGDEGGKNKTDVYEIIIKKLDEPDLRAMLDIASKEVKKRNLSSF